MPREHFEADEKSHLLPAPTAPYDIPVWCDQPARPPPLIAPDCCAPVRLAEFAATAQA